jgi:FAD/FMN-containing dehydrogenase
VIVEKASADIRRKIGTFGTRGTERRLMEEMKRAFDPEGRLNPGRHIDGE